MKHPIPAVCAVIQNERNEVLLVHESRFGVLGWWLPGGALPGGKSWTAGISEILARRWPSQTFPLQLFGVYSDQIESADCHPLTIAFQVVAKMELPDREDYGWFSPGKLPPETGRGDIRRIEASLGFRGAVVVG